MNNKHTEGIKAEHWDMEIAPHAHLFDLRLRELWHYRDLLLLFVRRDFVSFYKQTILGPIWFFIQPLFTTIVYTFIFGSLAGIPHDGIPGPLFYLAGITAWNYFSDCLVKTSTVFRDNSSVFGKVYFPRLIMPLSIVISNLIRFVVQMLMFFLVMAIFYFKGEGIHVNAVALLFPFLVVLMALLGLGTGMIVSALTTKYRDLAFLVTFGVQLMMYTTTVIYPLSEAVKKYPRYSWLISMNPMTPIIETFRYGFLGKGSFSWEALGMSTLVTIVLTVAGILIFNKVERNFIDTV